MKRPLARHVARAIFGFARRSAPAYESTARRGRITNDYPVWQRVLATLLGITLPAMPRAGSGSATPGFVRVRGATHTTLDHVLTTEQLSDIDHLADADVREMREEAIVEERDLTYLRRTLHSQIESIDAELRRRAARQDTKSSGASPQSACDPGFDTARQHSEPGEYRKAVEAELAEAIPTDILKRPDAELVHVRSALVEIDTEVSSFRVRVQAVINRLTTELVRRQREGHAAVDDLLDRSVEGPRTDRRMRSAVVIVDDRPVALRAMVALFADSEAVEVVASIGSQDDLPPDDTYDVVLLDLYLDDTGAPAVDVVERLSIHKPVVVMSAAHRPGDALALLRAGARGYVSTEDDIGSMQTALEIVATGGFALSPHLADAVQADLAASALRDGGPARASREQVAHGPTASAASEAVSLLSPREREVLRLIANGLTNAQVAKRMAVTKATVDTYVERIRMKLDLAHKAGLTRSTDDLHHERSRGGS